MKRKILIVSPHPDDETLGCGGYILKYKNKYNFHLMLVTKMKTNPKDKKYFERTKEIKKMKKKYKIKIEYFELRNKKNLKLSKKIINSKIFIAYYINKVRLIDNF